MIYQECAQLEAGVTFFIPGVGEQNIKFFIIASCTDKPAQSLLTNMVSHNANYSCAKCFTEGLSSVKIPTTTSRRFRTIKHIARFKANEFRSLMHHGSTVLLQAKLPKYRRHFALLLAAVNIASKDIIDNYDIILVKELLHQYTKDIWSSSYVIQYTFTFTYS
ncbi:unnamed protein product [Rotaria sp. Silwood1]|nr:unnamed protein product [Rotaria sp. Silwood1]CAF1070636.1 unnamed protein product [Rotaria sp. Silwood1]